MPHHSGQFVTAGDDSNQSQVYAHVATRQSKGIDRAIAHQKQTPAETLVQLRGEITQLPGRLFERLPDAL